MEQLGSQWKDLKKKLGAFFLNLSRNLKFHLNRTRKTRILHEDKYTFLQCLVQFFVEWEMFRTKVIEKTKILIFILCLLDRASS